MNSLLRIALVSLFGLGCVSPVFATTRFFLPGDAYFRTSLDEGFLENCEKGKPITLKYEALEYAFCGYAGVQDLRLEDPDGKLLERLTHVYRLVRYQHQPQELLIDGQYKSDVTEDGEFRLIRNQEKPRQVELNGLPLLVYNTSFDMTKFSLLHLYNENWMNELPENSGNGPGEVIETKKVILESWRRGAEVPPLQVTRKGSTREAAHLLPGGDLQIIILPSKDTYRSILNRKNDTVIYIIRNDGVYYRKIVNGKWAEEAKVTEGLPRQFMCSIASGAD